VSVHNREILLDIVVYVLSLQSIDSRDIFPVTDTYKETYAGRNLCMNLILSMDYINKYNLCGNVKYRSKSIRIVWLEKKERKDSFKLSRHILYFSS